MDARRIKEGVYYLGAVDWERRIFDALIPIPDGTTYNSFFIKGSEKTALVDTVDPSKAAVLMERLREVPVLDYVVANHAEPDHAGAIPQVLEKYPRARLVTTPRARSILVNSLGIAEDRFQTVENGQSLSLGDKTLTFIHTPWVHWPETMVSFLNEDRLLFTCDFFGSHYASNHVFVTDPAAVRVAAKRYYAEIMMPFREHIARHLETLAAYDIDVIAPSHGPVYHEPALILNAYRDWVLAPPKNLAVVLYISMHGATRSMVDHLAAVLTDRGVTLQRFDLTNPEIGKVATALVDAGTIVVGTPTVLSSAHPNAMYAAYFTRLLRPKARFGAVLCSMAWGTNAIEQVTEVLSGLELELFDPVLCQGTPGEPCREALTALADAIAGKHAEHGLRI